jgi:8-oxo-dGTP pyrophosphatase MutT (NUDIX family)
VEKKPPTRLSLACCGVVRSKDKKILITKRRPELIYPNAWVFAGGKLDMGENLLQACEREVYEEAGIDVEALAVKKEMILMYEAFHGPTKSGRYGHYLIFYYLFDLSADTADIQVNVQENEVSEYKWVDQEEFKAIV